MRLFFVTMMACFCVARGWAESSRAEATPTPEAEETVDIEALRQRAQPLILTEIDQAVNRTQSFMAAQMERMETSAQRIKLEFMMRTVFEEDLVKLRGRLLRSQRLTNPKVEELKGVRQALLKQLEELDERIATASEDTPEIEVLDHQREVNERRLAELRVILTPPEDRKPSKQPQPTMQ